MERYCHSFAYKITDWGVIRIAEADWSNHSLSNNTSDTKAYAISVSDALHRAFFFTFSQTFDKSNTQTVRQAFAFPV